jgi:tetratricopeptide (TPR) repeat protein
LEEEHYEDWELLAYIDASAEMAAGADLSGAPGVDTLTVERMVLHLRMCAQCRDSHDALRLLYDLLRDPAVHLEARSPVKRADERHIAQARAAASRMDADAAIAENTMQELLRREVGDWACYLSNEAPLQTAALVRRIIKEARAEYERRPAHALAVLEVATFVANHLTDVFALASERAAVARERANALRFLGRYAEALEELDRAERLLLDLPVSAFDLAFVAWSRATVLFYMTRYAESLSAVRNAIAVFRQFSDIPRVSEARMLEACILCEQGDVKTALHTWRELRAYFSSPEHATSRARVEANIAECEMRLGHTAEARRHAMEAMDRYALLQNVTEGARARWIVAHAYLLDGELETAEVALTGVRSTFMSLGMRAEAAEVLLDLVQIDVQRLAWAHAAEIAAQAAAEFVAMQAPVHVASALAHLSDAVRKELATPALVQYVRGYVNEAERELAFTPPFHKTGRSLKARSPGWSVALMCVTMDRLR